MSKAKFLLNNLEFLIGGLFSIIMVAVLFIQVVSRYVFTYSLAFSEELAVILFIMTVYVGAIGATRRNQHLKIELLTNVLKPRAKLIVNIIADITFMIANVFIIYGISKVTMNLFDYGMKTAILQIPKWICYVVLPFCFAVITVRLFQGVVVKAKQLHGFNK